MAQQVSEKFKQAFRTCVYYVYYLVLGKLFEIEHFELGTHSRAHSAPRLLSGQDALTTYEFNTGVAKHRFCRHCGIHSFYTPRSDPDKIDVNVRCLDGVDVGTLRVTPFDGRNWEASMTGRVPWR